MKRLIHVALMMVVMMTAAAESDSLERLRQCVRQEYQAATPHPDSRVWAATISADGTWPDINYADTSRSMWQLQQHLNRAVNLARYDNNSPQAIVAIRHWFAGRYVNDNWWYQKIGTPRQLMEIAYLLDDVLPDDLRAEIGQALSVIDADDYPARPGGDRIQVLSNHAKVLLWKRDADDIGRLFGLIEAEAAFGPLEETMYDAQGGFEVRNDHRPAGRGFQPDMSFHHRGDRVDCTMTYGMEVPEFYQYWDNLLKGTPWEFSAASRKFVSDYINGTVRWHLVRDRYTEPAAYNRELSRPVKAPHDIQFRDKQQLNGARYYYHSAYFAFKRPLYESAVRFHSQRNANQELAHNREGIHNHYRGDGACHLSVTGEEYLNIWPAFDFRRVPGVTSPITPIDQMPWNTVQLRHSPISFAGAVTDSVFGACALDFSTTRSDLRAHKSWFFFDEGYVCLGSGISCSCGDTIVTTIEQCLSTSGAFEQRDGWYIHDGNSYKILVGDDVDARCGIVHGTWENCVENATISDLSADLPVFLLAINHGLDPGDGRYAYAVAPRSESPQMWFEILSHSDTLHAVSSADGSLMYAAFFAAGTLSTPIGSVTVSDPCMMMIRDGEMYFSDPTHSLYMLNVEVDTGNNMSGKTLRLPTWQHAGSTVKY